MRRNSALYSFNRLCASVLVFVFSSVQFHPASYANAFTGSENAITSSSALQLSLDNLSIPKTLGSIVRTSKGSPYRVIFIQDAHASADAQSSIRNIISYLEEHYGVRLVLMEGASTEIDARILRSFPDKKKLADVLDEFMKQGEFSGGNAAAVFSPYSTAFSGVEDAELFKQGLTHYLNAKAGSPNLLKAVQDYRSRLIKDKRLLYPHELLSADEALEKFYSNELGFAELLQILSSFYPPKKEQSISLIVKKMGETAPHAVEGEARKMGRILIEQLNRISGAGSRIGKGFSASSRVKESIKDSLRILQAMEQDFNISRISAGAYLAQVKKIADRFEVNLPLSEVARENLDEEKKLQDLQGTKLFEDFQRYEKTVLSHLIHRLPSERREPVRFMEQRTRALRLIEKLIKLELSREDWNALSKGGVWDFEELKPELLIHHIAFYQNTLARDQAMFERIMKILKKEKKPAIFIGGGFHSQGLMHRFERMGIATWLVQPSVVSTQDGSLYERQMRGDVSWKKYLKVNHGTVSLRDAFLRYTRDKLLSDDPYLFRAWRNQLLVDAAAENRMEHVSRDTRILDEYSASKSLDAEIQQFEETWNRNLDRLLTTVKDIPAGHSANRKIMQAVQSSYRPVDFISGALSFDVLPGPSGPSLSRSELRDPDLRPKHASRAASWVTLASLALSNVVWGSDQTIKMDFEKPDPTGKVPVRFVIPPDLSPGRFTIQTSPDLLEWTDFRQIQIDAQVYDQEVVFYFPYLNPEEGQSRTAGFVRIFMEDGAWSTSPGLVLPDEVEEIQSQIPTVASGSRRIKLMSIPPANQPPFISSIGPQSVQEDQPLTLGFTIGDPDTSLTNLTLIARSTNNAIVDVNGLALGGSGTNRTLTLTPKLNRAGESDITIRVSDGAYNRDSIFHYTVVAANDPPNAFDIPDQTINQNTIIDIPFIIGDVDSPDASLVVTAESSNLALIDAAGIVPGGTGVNRTLKLTPKTGQIGTAIITVTVSDGSAVRQDTFKLTVNAVGNQAPTLSAIPDQLNKLEDTPVAVDFTIGDPDTLMASLTLIARSTNNAIVDTSGLVLSGTGANRRLTITPKPNRNNMESEIWVRVSDGVASQTRTFKYNVIPVNDPPNPFSIPNTTINMNTAAVLPFTVGDVDSPDSSLIVSAVSSNLTLIDASGIVPSGTGVNRVLTLTPKPNQIGSALITVAVSDGALTRTNTFTLTVNGTPVNQPPTLGNIANQSTNEDTPKNVGITIGDPDTPLANLVVEVTSSNTSLIDAAGIAISGTGANRTLIFTPKSHQFGSSTITVKVRDGVLETIKTFNLTVNSVNDPPSISGFSNQTLKMGDMTEPLRFTVGDVETPAANLTVIAFSSNTTLLANTNLIVAGAGTDRTLTVKPALGKTGTATVTVRVTDGNLVNRSTTFNVAVNPVTTPYVVLAWDFNDPAERVNNYNIYYSLISSNYSASIPVAAGNVNRRTIDGLPRDVQLFFVATAVNDAGLESLFSNQVDTRINSVTASYNMRGQKIAQVVAYAAMPPSKHKTKTKDRAMMLRAMKLAERKGGPALVEATESYRAELIARRVEKEKQALIAAAERRAVEDAAQSIAEGKQWASTFASLPPASEIHYDFSGQQVNEMGTFLRSEMRELLDTAATLMKSQRLGALTISMPVGMDAYELFARESGKHRPYRLVRGGKSEVRLVSRYAGEALQRKPFSVLRVTANPQGKQGSLFAIDRYGDGSLVRFNRRGSAARVLLAAMLSLTQGDLNGVLLREQPDESTAVVRLARESALSEVLDFALALFAQRHIDQSA